MEGQAESNFKAAHGFSKENRADCPLVTLGLVMNEHKFLHRTAILPGNASEPKTLHEMITSLDCHQSFVKPIIALLKAETTFVYEKAIWAQLWQYSLVLSAQVALESLARTRQEGHSGR